MTKPNWDFIANEHSIWAKVRDGNWEAPVISKLTEIVRPTDIIFDVGAWIGVYSLLLSRLAKQVVAFEPCPMSRKILIDNLEANDITNVIVEPYALSDKEGVEQIYYYNPRQNDDILAASMLNMVDRGRQGKGIPVHTTTIDKYCERKNIKPDGMKIDVEGYETKVLNGCTQDCWKIIEVHGSFAEIPKITGDFLDGDWNRGHIFLKS